MPNANRSTMPAPAGMIRISALPLSKTAWHRALARPVIRVRINLNAGNASGRMLTCDLTKEYVRINTDYS